MEVDATPPSVTPDDAASPASEPRKIPDMALAQDLHRLLVLSTGELDPADALAIGIPADLLDRAFRVVTVDLQNAALYRHAKVFGTRASPEDLAKMEERGTRILGELELVATSAGETAGDAEVLDARIAAAEFAAGSLGREAALGKRDEVLALPKLSRGKKIDAWMDSARVAMFYGDGSEIVERIEKASKLAEDGGDWDRRNRLKVYRALSKLLDRDFETASSLLLDCISTFSCDELCSYADFVAYATISNLLHLPRTQLKEKIIDGPEIRAVFNEMPRVRDLATALYDCDYEAYLRAVAHLQPFLVADRFLQPHAGFILRELHVLGYKQFLDSYKSVTLESMALSFGVGKDFLDLQLSRFIAAGRLTAKIDKYGGVVDTNRPDLKNAQYRDMIQKGDLLLNRIQKLARVVDM